MKPKSIETKTILKSLINFPDAQKEFKKVLKKAVSIKLIYFDFAYGVTPALFVVYATKEDEFLERIRLVREK